MCNSVKADYYYAEGYAKGIKTKWAANGNPSMCFELDSDLKEFKSLSEDHHPLYAISCDGHGFDNVQNYKVGNEKDSFFMPFYADCLISNAPLHIGIYFRSKDSGNKERKGKDEFDVESFKVIDEYR